MNFSDLQYKERHKKMGYLKELIDVGLTLNFTLLILENEYFVVGKNDVYSVFRNVDKWQVKGVFRKETVTSRLPDGVNTGLIKPLRVKENDDEWWSAELHVKTQSGLRELIDELIWSVQPNQKGPKIKLFGKE